MNPGTLEDRLAGAIQHFAQGHKGYADLPALREALNRQFNIAADSYRPNVKEVA